MKQQITFQQTLDSIRTVKGRVLAILLTNPSSRSDDTILILEYLKRHSNILVYNPESKLIEPVNKIGFSYQEWINSMRVFESIRRVREKLQSDAYARIEASHRALKHADPNDELIQPSVEISERRRQRQWHMKRIMS